MPRCRVADVDLHYLDQGSGPALVFVHGLGGSHLDWEHQLPAFAKTHRVIAPDLRGFGESARGWRWPGIARMAADIRGLLDKLGIERYTLVGHSMGGAVAQELALADRARLSALLISNSLPSFRPRRWPHVLEIGLRLLAMATLGPRYLARHIARRLYPLPDQAAQRMQAEQRGARNSRRAYLGALLSLSGWSALDRLGSLRQRVLVLESEFDYFAHEDVALFAGVLRNGGIRCIAGAHHALPSEQPAVFNAVLADFLACTDDGLVVSAREGEAA